MLDRNERDWNRGKIIVAGDTSIGRARRVVFSGRVQGVGFRVTTREIARKFPVIGYVRNQSDGTVEVVVAGVEDDVREFIAAVTRRFEGHISSVTETSSVINQEYDSFEIERS